MTNKPIVVIDGHDGAGKSTIASLVAAELGGRVIKPYSDSLGDLIAWLWQGEDFKAADLVARLAVKKCLHSADDRLPLVFDRHWLTMFTVLPEAFYGNWHPLPLTVLCWANLSSTLDRLAARGEPIGCVATHEFYLSRYLDCASRFGVDVVDTSSLNPHEAAASVLHIVRSKL